MLSRLNSVYESGNVMPVAFLKASHAAPLALLDPDVALAAPAPITPAASLPQQGSSVAGAPGAGGGASPASRGLEPGSDLSRSALRLVSDLAVDSMLAAVPQQMRENYKKQVRAPELAHARGQRCACMCPFRAASSWYDASRGDDVPVGGCRLCRLEASKPMGTETAGSVAVVLRWLRGIRWSTCRVAGC